MAHRPRAVVRSGFFVLILLCGNSWAQEGIKGFSLTSAARERQVEQRFKAIPSPKEERRQHRFFTAEPHPAGSKRNNDLAQYIAGEWRKQGMEDVVVRQYDVYSTEPKSASLVMVAPVSFKASLREAAYDADPDTKDPHISSAWTGMSISGDVTAPVVYAHSGNPADYDFLRKQGIDVKGKIVLVRYSNPYSYRGFKALTAQREGAAAILIYSDPAEDGFKKGKAFPEGPWGPESHIQRGAITYDFMVPGDPLTPGWASVPGAKRIAPEEAQSLPKIMALPLSWADAKPLLENMGGPVAPDDWQGGLPLQYHLGGDKARVHLKIEMDNSIKPYYVVEARIRGAEVPDEWIVLGNHRDAWVFGGVDPSSGTASMMEMTRAFGALLKQGIRPRRTLVFCSWDGEEVGLTGSTEWGEQFADELRNKAVAYINVDSSVSGPDFDGSAVGSLAPMLVETSHTLKDPSGTSLYEAWRNSRARKIRENKKESAAPTDFNLVDTRIGSGSDHTVFLNYVGIPVIGLSFDGPYGVYHSAYDNFYWMNHFGDPGYRYHTLASNLWGVLALRLANADLLPFDFAAYAQNVRDFVMDMVRGKDLSQLDLKPLLRKLDEFEAAGRNLNTAVSATLAEKSASQSLNDVNQTMLQVERNWLNQEGIPGRPWFKHTLYGARYTYAHLELPGLTEAVEQADWPRAKQQARILEDAVDHNTKLIEGLASRLEGRVATKARGSVH
jgi:N-acetylated-alpha-linked acidic dipeptidase